ncbi:MAG TPA: hypothetical protein VNP04_15530 [Alphaproteobacteria bacterium]|nr:hypothetical protein [Alphaproteobacteria bacterium]
MEAALQALLQQTVTIFQRVGTDGYGQPLYDSGTPVKARVAGDHRLVRTATGQEVVSSRAVWVDGRVTVTAEAAIGLPDGQRLPILAVETFPDASGKPHHHKLRV